jgi:MFS family permease
VTIDAEKFQETSISTKEINSSEKFVTPELIAVLFVCSMAFYATELLNPILSLYLDSLGMNASTIGLMFSAMMVGIAVSEIFWGWVVDRVDLRVAIFVGTVLCGVMIFALNHASTVLLVGTALVFYGFCRSPIFIVGRWYMSVYAPAHRKAFAMALLSATIGLVQSLGGFSSGYITESRGFGFTFTLAAGLSIGAGILMLIAGRWLNFQKHKQSEHGSDHHLEAKNTVSKGAKLTTVSLGLIGVLYFVAFGVLGTYLPLFATEVVGVSTSQVGVLFGIRGLVTAILMISLGRFVDRKDKWTFVLLGLSVVAVSTFGIAFSNSYSWLLVSVLIFAGGSAVYFPSITAILSHSVPVSWTGTAMGIFGFMEDLGWMIGPAIGGLLWVSLSKPAAFWFSGLVVAAAIPLVYVTKNKIAKMSAAPQVVGLEPVIRVNGD